MSIPVPTVLVVDDDPDIREVLQMLLEADGYRVTTAGDGHEAWERIEGRERPALILLDLMMPRMNGERLLQLLRSSSGSSIPVVIMSGHGDSPEKTAMYRPSRFLTKPIELDHLLDVVHQLVPASKQGTLNGAPVHP
jgi:CheY-like chemotaxis protein